MFEGRNTNSESWVLAGTSTIQGEVALERWWPPRGALVVGSSPTSTIENGRSGVKPVLHLSMLQCTLQPNQKSMWLSPT